MTGSIFWRIVWKEYRTQRGFWLAVLGMAFVAQLFVWANVRNDASRAMLLFLIALFSPAIYALACGAVLVCRRTRGWNVGVAAVSAGSVARKNSGG